MTGQEDITSKARAYLEATGWTEQLPGGPTGTIWFKTGVRQAAGTYTAGQIIEYHTSCGQYSIGQVVHYEEAEQDNPGDLWIYIRVRSGSKPVLYRESQLRTQSTQIGVPYQVTAGSFEWNGIVTRLAEHEHRQEAGIVASILGILSDADAIEVIAEWLRDPDWDCPGMLADIANVICRTGRTVENYPDGRGTWDRH